MEGRRRADVVLRLLLSHGLAYPVAVAWALGSIPIVAVAIASAEDTALDAGVAAHRVLLRVVWPMVGSFVGVHAAGLSWALSRDAARGRRVFLVTMAVLAIVPVVVGGGSWLWLMSR